MKTQFWERFTELCDQNDTTPNAVMLETGLNTGNPTAWKNGRTPGTKIAKILADYFGVSVDYLLTDKEKQPTVTDGLSEKDQRLIDWFRSLPPEKQQAILILQGGPEDAL